MGDVIRVAPSRIRYKFGEDDRDADVAADDWDLAPLCAIERTAKHRSIMQRYRDGLAWEDTDLFRLHYPARFAAGTKSIRGCESLKELAALYYSAFDALFAHLKAHGFKAVINGTRVPLPDAYLTRAGELVLGNQGNHRVAMAKVLGLPFVLMNIAKAHPLLAAIPEDLEAVEIDPKLHEGADAIPAMTTPAERYAYYELAKSAAGRGDIVELGTWLGAATAYIAAGVRDARVARPMHTYDRFQWQPIHEYKTGAPLERPMLEQVKVNLGPLLPWVEVHAGEISAAQWNGRPISLLIADGPKRIHDISRAMEIFGTHMRTGAMMAWQDFAYFASYDLPAYFDRLERLGKVFFIRSVYPGTTAIFRVEGALTAADVNVGQAWLDKWTDVKILKTWNRWRDRFAFSAQGRFMCGAVLFLCDRGYTKQGTQLFRDLLKTHRQEITSKWRYFRETRSRMVSKYPSLDAAIGPC